jgi:hypothetical protein
VGELAQDGANFISGEYATEQSESGTAYLTAQLRSGLALTLARLAVRPDAKPYLPGAQSRCLQISPGLFFFSRATGPIEETDPVHSFWDRNEAQSQNVYPAISRKIGAG